MKDKVSNDFGIPLVPTPLQCAPGILRLFIPKAALSEDTQVVVTGLLNVILSDWPSLLTVRDWRILLKISLLAGALKRDLLHCGSWRRRQ